MLTIPRDRPYKASEAIAREEGFWAGGTRPARNHNPGDIEYGKFTIAHGATGTDGRFAIFPDDETGMACLVALLKSAYLGLTLDAATLKWAPLSENNHAAYADNVCDWMQVAPSTILTEGML